MKTFDSVGIKEGLGDCLIAAACVQEYYKIYNKKLTFITSPLLQPILSDNPNFYYSSSGKAELKLLWPSQSNPDLYRLHTTNRFSSQMGFNIDPTVVVDIYQNGNLMVNKPENNTVCINSVSAEKNRRFIPEYVIDFLLNFFHERNVEIKWIGDNYKNVGTRDIVECVNLLETCSLFIGPISFQYHLASAMRVPSLLFCSYMPYYKYSNFTKVEHMSSDRPCSFLCEEHEEELRVENDCFSKCKAVNYDLEELEFKLNKLL